jgi:hypothetical protein
MKCIVLGLLLSSSVWAENSKIIPTFLEASEIYVRGQETSADSFYLRPDIKAALRVLELSQIDPLLLEKRIILKNNIWPLRDDDQFDQWVKEPQKVSSEVPEMAVHAYKFKVVEPSDSWFKDDIYVYYFITDGVIPTGKVSSIYKGLGKGQSFFFNEIDRAIFPLVGLPSKRPTNHLIIDYGIVESDGDDIKELQKLSSIIIDIAIAVYTSYDPQGAQILIELRKEIKALAELLLSTNHDDRLATGSFGYKAQELSELMRENTYVELTKKHHSHATFGSWEYHLSFRFLRD